MKYCILNISDSDKHWAESINEYIKRLWKEVFLENLKPIKNGSQNQIIQKETELILDKLENKYKDWNKVLLSKSGEQYSTENLWKFLWYEKTIFIIGWPYWLNEDRLLEVWVKRISFGEITLPHGLAKLILLEQIYRIWTIKSWKKYHY